MIYCLIKKIMCQLSVCKVQLYRSEAKDILVIMLPNKTGPRCKPAFIFPSKMLELWWPNLSFPNLRGWSSGPLQIPFIHLGQKIQSAGLLELHFLLRTTRFLSTYCIPVNADKRTPWGWKTLESETWWADDSLIVYWWEKRNVEN